MGSVKDLSILKKQKEKEAGIGRFIFSDRYSVFDWGKMPDHIPNKGAALCLMGAYCFEKAEKEGMRTHYRGLVRKDGKAMKLSKLKEPTNIMEVDLVRSIRPKFTGGRYDYSAFTTDLTNFVIPIEVIYRNGLPVGSSVFRRLDAGQITFQDLGLKRHPKPGEKLKKPILDLSTKFEEEDRYISWKKAQEMVGLSDKEVKEIKKILLAVDKIITRAAKRAKLINEDGKIELAYDKNRELILVDVVGTQDECRFTHNGTDISKEAARQFYKRTPWYNDAQEAKKKAEEKGIQDWKKLCKSKPQKLDPKFKKILSDLYTSTANAFLGKKFFDSPKLENVITNYKRWFASK